MKKSLQHRLLEVLKGNPGVSVKELASILEVDVNKVKVAAYRLKSMGYIEKAGRGYIVTKRGLQFLNYLESRLASKTDVEKARKTLEEKREASTEAPPSKEPVREMSRGMGTPQVVEDTINTLIEKLQELERRIISLEARVRGLEGVVASTQKRPDITSLLDPVMYYNEAVTKYGSLIEKMLSDKRLIRIGSLVVNTEFYAHFKSRFPIKLSDVEKLSPHEKILLEEMRKEALIVLHAGKEYRMVE
ncbi:MAG: winged helix-turn-helix transcriptional regulator [Desulfurococcaceae archaeon]